MSSADAFPRFRHPLGLPGKSIKLQREAEADEAPERGRSDNHRREPSPLGISLTSDDDEKDQRHKAEHAGECLKAQRCVGTANEGLDSMTAKAANNIPNEPGNNLRTPAIILHSPKHHYQEMSEPSRQDRMPRAPSSIYTLAQTPATPTHKVSKLPRLNLASIPSVTRLGMPFASIKTPASARTPPSSAGTDFEDVGSNSPHSSRIISPTNPNRSVRRVSLDTVPPTPRRSRGWWNVLLNSPLEAKKMSLGSSPKDRVYVTDPDAPAVPVLNRAAPMCEVGSRESAGDEDDHQRRLSMRRSSTGSVWSRVRGGEADKYYSPYRFADEDEFQPVDGFKSLSRRSRISSWHGSDAENGHDEKHPLHNVKSSYTTPKLSRSPSPKPGKCLAPLTSPSSNEKQCKPTTPPDRSTNEYFSSIVPGTPVQHARHARQPTATTATPGSHFDIMSPGVVQVADARPIQTARSIHTKNSRVSFKSTRDNDRPTTEAFFAPQNGHRFDDHQTGPPLPPKPAYLEKSAFSVSSLSLDNEKGPRSKPKFFNRLYNHKHDTEDQHVDQRFRFEKRSRRPCMWTDKRKTFAAIAVFIILVVLIIIVLLCLTVTRKYHDMPVAASWVSLAGYPAIPTGIATIAQPSTRSESSCVTNTDMWSCALPKEEQADLAQSAAGQPNFRLEIRFTGTDQQLANSTSSPISRRALLSRSLVRTAHVERDAFNDITKAASPPPPSKDDQVFLGNTTDAITAPFEGESTPFVISFLSTTNPSTKATTSPQPHAKRDDNTTVYDHLPAPTLGANSTAAPAQLYPSTSSQPLRIFNRGREDEHYGFYTYFDKSIFMLLDNASGNSPEADNDNGGHPRGEANALCIFSQTRFHVQLWTRRSTVSAARADNATGSATAFEKPGTFPMPVTITLDRHSGDASKKGVYCYGLSEHQRPNGNQKAVIGEARDMRGMLVNPAIGPFEQVDLNGYGGSDGGNGGCGCTWENFGG